MAGIKGDQNILRASLMPVIHRAVLASCDSADGLHDGLLNDPRKCASDPSTLLCRGASNENCLTADQVEAVNEVIRPFEDQSRRVDLPLL
jgi:feruloyl esterase